LEEGSIIAELPVRAIRALWNGWKIHTDEGVLDLLRTEGIVGLLEMPNLGRKTADYVVASYELSGKYLGKTAVTSYCLLCGHIFTSAHIPMTAYKLAKIAEGLRCPMCAAPNTDIRIKTLGMES